MYSEKYFKKKNGVIVVSVCANRPTNGMLLAIPSILILNDVAKSNIAFTKEFMFKELRFVA